MVAVFDCCHYCNRTEFISDIVLYAYIWPNTPLLRANHVRKNIEKYATTFDNFRVAFLFIRIFSFWVYEMGTAAWLALS